ncbi:hypothetical protein EDC04DRAFT_1725860 [Pisolithus marmoratus]|nr:hypothetical protein EDC04DRAFT_1725860 [Pisolithus marmoratus]
MLRSIHHSTPIRLSSLPSTRTCLLIMTCRFILYPRVLMPSTHHLVGMCQHTSYKEYRSTKKNTMATVRGCAINLPSKEVTPLGLQNPGTLKPSAYDAMVPVAPYSSLRAVRRTYIRPHFPGITVVVQLTQLDLCFPDPEQQTLPESRRY